MKFILVFTLLFFLNTYSQTSDPNSKVDSNLVFSRYETIDYKNEGDKVRKLLSEEKSALIIDMQYNRYISLTDNEITYYTRCEDSIINIIQLNKSDRAKCKILIDSLVKINPEKLIEADTTQKTIYSHYSKDTSLVSITKGDKILKLITSHGNNWTPEYIFPEVRKKFSDTYLSLRRYFYDEEFERIKSLDTIYLYVERGKNMQYVEYIKKEKNFRHERYQFKFKCSEGILMNSNISSFSEPSGLLNRDRSFLSSNSMKILRIDYLKKFDNYDLHLLINSNMRKVFIIDKDEIVDGKLKIKEIKVGVFYLYY